MCKHKKNIKTNCAQGLYVHFDHPSFFSRLSWLRQSCVATKHREVKTICERSESFKLFPIFLSVELFLKIQTDILMIYMQLRKELKGEPFTMHIRLMYADPIDSNIHNS